MKFVKMKIRDHFLQLIKDEIKKNEYRLASPKYKDIHVGDVLILVSKQDKNRYEKVVVEEITKYKNWNDAFQNRWESDFRGLYSSLDELLKECYKFYTKEEVELYGIEVFGFKPYKLNLKASRVLLDTNIIVERESSNNYSKEVSLLFSWFDRLNCVKMIHPRTREELSNYKDENIKKMMLSKLNSYIEIVPNLEKNESFDEVCQNYSQDSNSLIDNEILLQVYNGRVDYLVTEDKLILHKARDLYIKENVLSPNELLQVLEDQNPKLIDYDVLSVRLVKIGSIDVNSSFFDSLREDYNGAAFNAWFQRKSEESAYVFENNSGIQGFLYLKTEDENEKYPYFEPTLSSKKRLKVGTFKINSSGLRLGERFLKIIFDNAKLRNVDEVYVTLFENKRKEVANLKGLMEQWGFNKKGFNTKNGEIYLVKDMRQYDCLKSPKYNYPLVKEKHKISFLPLLSAYHTRLFPDLHLKNENMRLYTDEACRYAIEKIYVCGWKNINLNPGDLMCVYRMSDYYKSYRSVVSGIAILNEIVNPTNVEDFVKECKNKSVFSEKELRDFYKGGKYRTIIKVLFLESFDNKINLRTLWDDGIIEMDGPGPRINTLIDDNKYDEILKLGRNSD